MGEAAPVVVNNCRVGAVGSNRVYGIGFRDSGWQGGVRANLESGIRQRAKRGI